MNFNESDKTISNTKEESIAKAILLLQNEKNVDEDVCRPDISVARTVMLTLLLLLLIILLPIVCLLIGLKLAVPTYLLYPIALLAFLAVVALTGKTIVKKSVLLYQKLAPAKLRKSCLFEPSCSEYMLLSVEKYGLCVGVAKGINRLCRCHHPNGGVDYP